MEDSSPILPTTNLPKRAHPSLKIDRNNGNSIMNELKRSLFSPTSVIRRPTFRNKQRSLTFLYSFILILLFCTIVFVFRNSHIHQSSEWLKNMLKNRELAYADRIHPHVSKNSYALVPSRSNAVNLNSDFKNYGSHSIKNKTNDKMLSEGKNNRNGGKSMAKSNEKSWVEMMSKCDIFDGKWLKDDSPPLYEPGSCPCIDQPFNCYQNGRTDNAYQKFRWQPNHCNIPRLDGRKMLKFLKRKRIVYVGDSLNRNMWESMVCLLRNSVKDKSRVFEASGRIEFKKEGTYSFLFPDYNLSVEYIRSAFLVQEWEVLGANGAKKETLRLDLVDNSYDTYKDADVLVFNTGHWWTHQKTSEGKGYYQEGNHVHSKMDVIEAFHKAMNTWTKWIEDNINPMKTFVFFRGYSLSHFSEGEWDSGGKCDTNEPIKNEKDLVQLDQLHPPIPQMLEKSLAKIKKPFFYLNVTRMTNYRKDAHPSIYRKPNMSLDEKRTFLKHQDCSHWCLPGVPDTWNQLLFAKLMWSHKQRQLQQQSYRNR